MFEYCEHKVSEISKKNQEQKCLYSAPFTFRFHNPPIETVAVKTNQKTSVERIFEKPISTCRTFLRDVFLLNFCKRNALATSFLRIAPLNDDGQLKGEPVRRIARDRMYACIRITRQFACKASLPIDMPRAEASNEKSAVSRNLCV